MPNAPDNATDTPAQLPWESIGDEPDAPAAVAEVPRPTDSGEAELLDYAEVEADAEAPSDYDTIDDTVHYERPVPAEPLEEDLGPAPKGGGWTVAILCAGIAIIACCVVIPQADANRRLVYEREKLKVDLDSVRKQVSTNDEFLHRVADDPNLAERLAQRQMRVIREGTRVLELKKSAKGAGPLASAEAMSPFHLVHVAPPPPMPPYEPTGGRIASLCYDPQKRLYLMGGGLMLMAAGLVLGVGSKE